MAITVTGDGGGPAPPPTVEVKALRPFNYSTPDEDGNISVESAEVGDVVTVFEAATADLFRSGCAEAVKAKPKPKKAPENKAEEPDENK